MERKPLSDFPSQELRPLVSRNDDTEYVSRLVYRRFSLRQRKFIRNLDRNDSVNRKVPRFSSPFPPDLYVLRSLNQTFVSHTVIGSCLEKVNLQTPNLQNPIL